MYYNYGAESFVPYREVPLFGGSFSAGGGALVLYTYTVLKGMWQC